MGQNGRKTNLMEMREGAVTFLNRMPLAILGAIGLVSFAGSIFQFEQHIGVGVHVWQAATRPLWEFFLGWLFDWLGTEFPLWAKDYATVGLITAFASLRQETNDKKDLPLTGIISYLIIACVLWPVTVISTVVALFQGKIVVFANGDSAVLFSETYLYAAAFIVINYALIVFGAQIYIPELAL